MPSMQTAISTFLSTSRFLRQLSQKNIVDIILKLPNMKTNKKNGVLACDHNDVTILFR